MKSNYIKTSIFDIFKSGPGPSSSHTIGPMIAAHKFLNNIIELKEKNTLISPKINVSLYGSLSSTGEGHGTHRAVLAGLLGWEPSSCDCAKLKELMKDKKEIYSVHGIDISSSDIIFAGDDDSLEFQNTLICTLVSDGKVVLEKEYYSIGGGFITCKGEKEPKTPTPPYHYHNMNQFKKISRKNGLTLTSMMIENEKAITGATTKEIYKKLDHIIQTMYTAVENGLQHDGLLPGPIGLLRKANSLYQNSQHCDYESERSLARLNAYAIAVSEENAASERVVTAPTSGSAGVIPGVIYLLHKHLKLSKEKIRDGFLAAALIAFIAKHNASIAGAEVGCQGEIGVASAMAAALITHARGFNLKTIENAAEIALEHHLGMTCDPIDGYVQVPCIERNAVGAVTAFNAFILASVGDPVRQKITFDEVVEAMLETGEDMSKNYKETARGGLAICCVSC